LGQARLLAVLLSLTWVLLCAAAPATAALDLDSTLAKSGYSSTEKQTIQSVFTQADHAGVPRDFLLPRLAEGIAKGVPFAQTAQVLTNALAWLEKAKALMESTAEGRALVSDPASWSLSATLLETGAGEQEIQMLESAAQGKSASYRMAGFLHASLVSWGLPRPLSLQVAVAALRSVVSPEQYLGIVNVFEQGRQKRISPERLAERVVEALKTAKDLEDVKRAVLY
jgi:hypothetical protein